MLRCSKADFEEVDFSCGNPNLQVNQKSFNKKLKSVGMTLAKVKEQDGMTLAKVRHAQVSHALH